MVDLDELDRMHAALPELEPASWMSHEDDGGTALVIATAMCEDDYEVDAAEGLATNAVAILNAWPEVSRELRDRRANAPSGELAALRALAVVVKAQCDWAHPNWAPEIREALALAEKAKAK